MYEWDCYECKKLVHNDVVKCLPCKKNFHPGCVQKHRIWNKDNDLVNCTGKKNIKRNKEKEKGEIVGTVMRKNGYRNG